MEKQNSQGNYIMGSFRVLILYQVKIRRMGGGGGGRICMYGILRNLSEYCNIINVGTNLGVILKCIKETAYRCVDRIKLTNWIGRNDDNGGSDILKV
jgi:hypothetical protein